MDVLSAGVSFATTRRSSRRYLGNNREPSCLWSSEIAGGERARYPWAVMAKRAASDWK